MCFCSSWNLNVRQAREMPDKRGISRVWCRQNLAHPQIQQLGDGAVFESSDKILPWFCYSGTSSDGLLLRSVPARTSSSKTLPCVSNRSEERRVGKEWRS